MRALVGMCVRHNVHVKLKEESMSMLTYIECQHNAQTVSGHGNRTNQKHYDDSDSDVTP